jgi:hypothetical protein
MRNPAAIATILLLAATASGLTLPERRAYLEWMLEKLPEAPAWAEWQRRTAALPPDFDLLPSANFLPDPFRFHDGRPVRMPADWAERREEIRRLFETHVVGKLPPRPKLGRVLPVSEVSGQGYVTRTVRLEYGRDNKASSQITLTLPAGSGPFPVVLGGGMWSTALIRRGYAACEFPSSVDQATELPALYPEFDFATMGQRAWTVQVVIDYLLTLPTIDPARIAITGYSRGGAGP